MKNGTMSDIIHEQYSNGGFSQELSSGNGIASIFEHCDE